MRHCNDFANDRNEDHLPNEIDVATLTTCDVAPDGHYVRLHFEDTLGRPAALRLTSDRVQQLLMTVPGLLSRALQARHKDDSVRAVFPLHQWRLETAAGSKDFILTLITADGFEVAFSLSARTIVRIRSALEEHHSRAAQGPTRLFS
jgi:hypothetical protein